MGNNGLIFLMFGALALGGVGLYVMTRNKSPGMGSGAVELDVTKDSSGQLNVSGTNTDLGNISFSPSRSIFTTDFDYTTRGAPITGGSLWGHDGMKSVRKFDELAYGTCQCDYDQCCYKTIYQPKRGEPKTEKECRPVYYGDMVDACTRAVRAAEENTFRAVVSARARKYMAGAVNARLGRIYS